MKKQISHCQTVLHSNRKVEGRGTINTPSTHIHDR